MKPTYFGKKKLYLNMCWKYIDLLTPRTLSTTNSSVIEQDKLLCFFISIYSYDDCVDVCKHNSKIEQSLFCVVTLNVGFMIVKYIRI
jgi:hypothetical protein